MNTGKYSLPLRILHWLIAFSILMLIAVGWRMSGLPRDDTNRALLYFLHKSFGVTVLMLVIARIIVKIKNPGPPLPDAIPKLERKLAETGYIGVYALMLATPLLGYLMTNAFGFAAPWFGINMPKIITEPNRELGGTLNTLHAYCAYALLVFAIAHVSAVIRHRVKDKVNLLKRMW